MSDEIWERIKDMDKDKVKDYINSLDEDTVVKLMKDTRQFNDTVYKCKYDYLAFSYINFKEEVYQKLITTGVIQFLYQIVTEYEPEDSDKYMSELDGAFYGCYRKNMALLLLDKYKDDSQMLLSIYDKFNIKIDTTDAETQTDTHTTLEPPVTLPDIPDLPESDIKTLIQETKKELKIDGTDTKEEHILNHRLIVKSFLDKFFLKDSKKSLYQFNNFYQSKYEEIKEVANSIHDGTVIPKLEMALLPLEVFKTREEYDKFISENSKTFDYSVYLCRFNVCNILTSIKANKDVVEFSEKNNPTISKMLESAKTDASIGKRLIKQKMESIKSDKDEMFNLYNKQFNAKNSDIQDLSEICKDLHEPEEPNLNEVELGFNVISADKSNELLRRCVSHRYKFNMR